MLQISISKQTFLFLSQLNTNNDNDWDNRVEVCFSSLITIRGAHNVQTSLSATHPSNPRRAEMPEDDDVLSFKGSYRFINRVKRCCTVLLLSYIKRWIQSTILPALGRALYHPLYLLDGSDKTNSFFALAQCNYNKCGNKLLILYFNFFMFCCSMIYQLHIIERTYIKVL